ncbi:MAG TPA: FixH family protein [Vineibacter sp.]|nr:FixH family protein [Vineibacter sp.]
MKHLILAACLYLVATSAAAQAPRQRVDLACQPTEASLVYLCTLAVADAAGKPVDGADVTLSADMPSMPMAHNVKPVKAQPVAGKPGTYQSRIELEMLGEWAVKLQFKAPRVDVVVRKLDFQKDKVSPATAR